MTAIPVVDFFAGPGGLGEGFSAFRPKGNTNPFRIVLSVEKEPSAHKTLRLRAFARRFQEGELPSSYYRYIRGEADCPWDDSNRAEWEAAESEALCATLGDPAGDEAVDAKLRSLKLRDRTWILIGGPPCQAFSLVGRSRNAGVSGYRPENDERHFLYRNYLRVLRELRPPAFVFENVRGILTSSVSGEEMFRGILEDLSRPALALQGSRSSGVEYRLRAVSSRTVMNPGDDPAGLDWRDFVVRSEKHGVPQTRHRVILIGVRSDLDVLPSIVARSAEPPDLSTVIGGLPRLRSGLSRKDSERAWQAIVLAHSRKIGKILARVASEPSRSECAAATTLAASDLPSARFSAALPDDRNLRHTASALAGWYRDAKLGVTLNHDTRAHMPSDLGRYLFCAMFASATGRSPTSRDFPASLAPDHNSWESGDFANRFRVQLAIGPATTITSHIAKDGHYFIHYDPSQCRSLTVREAARIQTFPDNYFFEGARTPQYIQVGNAVPPVLAMEIARLVHQILQNCQ